FQRHDGNFVQGRALRRPPAPLARDDLVSVLRTSHRTYHYRLDDAAFLDRRGQLIELGIGKVAARITRIGSEISDRDAALGARTFGGRRRRFGADVAHERGKAASQSRSAVICHCHVSRPSCVTLRRAVDPIRWWRPRAARLLSIPSRAE